MAQPVDHLIQLDVTMVAIDSTGPNLMGMADQFPETPMEPSL